MTLLAANVPSVIDADIEVDVSGDNDFAVATDIKADMTQIDVTGGDFPSQPVQTWDGVISALGLRNEVEVTLTCVYSDGETNDTWETLYGAIGDVAAMRWMPKGDTIGNRWHVVTGRLRQVSLPTAGGSGAFTYQAIFVGTPSFGTVSA